MGVRPMPEFARPKDVARYLGVSVRHVRRIAAELETVEVGGEFLVPLHGILYAALKRLFCYRHAFSEPLEAAHE